MKSRTRKNNTKNAENIVITDIKPKKSRKLNFCQNNQTIDEYSDPEIVENEDTTTFSINNLSPVDLNHLDDPLNVPLYAEKIIINAKNETDICILESNSLSKTQTEIDHRIRNIVINWITALHQDLFYLPETLMSTVFYFDKVLSKVNIPKKDVQMVGAVCLLISSKINERKPSGINYFIKHSNYPYTPDDFRRCEQMVIRALNYQLEYPSKKLFLQRFLDCINADQEFIHVANFICESTIFNFELNQFSPDQIAFGCIIITALELKRKIPFHTIKHSGHFKDIKFINSIIEPILKSAHEIITLKTGPIYHRYTATLSNVILNLKFDSIKLQDITK